MRNYSLVDREAESAASVCRVLPVGGGIAFADEREEKVNRVIGLGLDVPVRRAEIEEILDFYFRRDATVRIELCTWAHPSLMAQLEAHKFVLREFRNVWCRPLSADSVSQSISAGFTIQRIGDTDIDLWSKALEAGMGGNAMQFGASADQFRDWHRTDGCQVLGICRNREEAGGGILAVVDRTALLLGACTIPGFRRHGAYKSLLIGRLFVAAAMGCNLAMLRLPPGHRVEQCIQGLGFRLAYTTAVMESPYLPSPLDAESRPEAENE